MVTFVPIFALALIAGEMADRYDRRKILLVCASLQMLCSVVFALLTVQHEPSLVLIFLTAGLFGVSRAFSAPAWSIFSSRQSSAGPGKCRNFYRFGAAKPDCRNFYIWRKRSFLKPGGCGAGRGSVGTVGHAAR